MPVVLYGGLNLKITVTVKLNSKKESVEISTDGTYLVRVNAPPVDNKANERVVELLCMYFCKPKSAFSLVRGQKSKKKVFSVE